MEFRIIAALCALVLFAADPYQAEIENWQRQRESSLRSDTGWLTVSGLFWLKQGSNRFGSDASNEIVLPAAAPARAGVFEFDGSKVSVAMDGRTRELKPDSAASENRIEIGSLTLFVIKRGDRYGIRMRDTESRYRRQFAGLHYFPIDPQHRVTAKFVAHPSRIPIANIIGQTELMDSPGYAVFEWGGRELRLYPVIEDPSDRQLFYIFRDQTSGKETYGAGRFLYSGLPQNGAVVLDFDKAYNPPCAFTPYATCSLPPKENRLPVRVEAGEMKYGGH